MVGLKKNWIIIPFSENEAEHSACLHQKCFEDAWSVKSFKELSRNICTFGFLAKDINDSKTKGLILGQLCQSEAEIYTLAAHPSQRRQGIATLLIENFIILCLSQSIESIFIEVNENNAAALIFYQNIGFVCYGKRPKYYVLSNNDFADAVLLQLKINKN